MPRASFGSGRTALACLLAAAAASAFAEGAGAAGSTLLHGASLPAGVRVLHAGGAGSERGGAAMVDALERAGYRVHVALLPETFLVSGRGRGALPSGVRELATMGEAGTGAGSAPAARAAAAAPSDPFAGRADVIRRALARRAAAFPSGAAPDGVRLPEGLAYGTRWEDTSELMVGRVAVPILFPESDGTIDPDRYDWTPALRDSVVRSAVRGFLKWSLHAAAKNVPLTFLLEIHAHLATRYEPIERTVAQETIWIEDALEPMLGHRTDALSMAYEVANAARARLGAHWAALAFAVQNDTDSTGSFPDGLIAHAELGGPWLVIPVNNLNTRSATLDYYFEHEITHVFWALDEFTANNAWWSCLLTAGYFNQPNWNSRVPFAAYCGPEPVNCVMAGNWPDDFCAYTEGQVGWVDRDQSGILDLWETSPVVQPDSVRYRAPAGVPLTLTGTAREAAHPNENPEHFFAGDSISIAVIDSVQYRPDGGAWTTIPCGDLRCDSGSERFRLVLAPPAPGTHTVEWRAWNSSGRTATTPSATQITISGSAPRAEDPAPAERAARLRAWPVPSRDVVFLGVGAAPGARADVRIYDAAGRVARAWSLRVPSDGEAAGLWDGRTDRGGRAPAGLYWVTVTIGGETTVRRRIVLLR